MMNITDTKTRLTTINFSIGGMDCSDCELVLEHRLSRLDGVFHVEADFVDQTVQVQYDPQRIHRGAIKKRISQMGYDPIPPALERWLRSNRELIFSLLSGLLLLLGWLGGWRGWFSEQTSFWFIFAAYLPAGYDVGRASFQSLRQRHFDTDMLMFVAALGAAALGHWAEGALLIFLFGLGHALQERALDRARNAVRSLADLTPRWATVKRADRDELVAVERLAIGDIVVVRPGERLPVDGAVVQGNSYVNQAPLTGESIPVERTPGEAVLSGSLNLDGTLEVRVQRLAKDSTLQRVMKLVEQAQAAQSPTQMWVERFTQIFVPVVLLVCLGLLAYPLIIGAPFETGFVRAVTFLVATSPCALALGTPSAVISGIAQAARHGVLVKGGVHLENLGRLQAIAFDKTGTLTLGEPRVTDVIALPGWSENRLLELASAIESRSNHPLAQAVTRRAEEMGLAVLPAEAIENLAGRGMRARLNGHPIWIGSLTLWAELSLELPESLLARMQALQAQGKTLILVAEGDQTAGLIAVSDVLRSESRSALDELEHLGVKKTILLSGDNPRAAAEVAAQSGIADFRAGLLPEEKLRAVADLIKTFQYVGMVGDGVNDAPALAQATVGIALGGSRNDLALEAADVALMSSDLCKLPFAVGLGKAVQHITLQNLVISLLSIVLLAGLSLLGAINIGVTVFFHEGATLLVVGNALRLFAFERSCGSNADSLGETTQQMKRD